MFSSYMDVGFIISIILTLIGNYILDRFKLELRNPKLAILIKYRKKKFK